MSQKSTIVKSREIEELKLNKRDKSLLEQQLEILTMVFKRVYRENLKHVYAASAGEAPQDEDLQKFKDSMNILNLSPDQLKNFISANSHKKSRLEFSSE